MLALEQHGRPGGEHLERRDAQVVEARDRPAVPPVGSDEPVDIGALRPGAREDVVDVDPALHRAARGGHPRVERRASPPRRPRRTGVRSSSSAFSDHGMISPSSRTQPASSSSHRPVSSIAERMPRQERRLHPVGGEERAPGAGEHPPVALDPEALARDRAVAADEDHRARAHVLLLADHLRDALAPVLGERLVRVFEEALAGARRGRRHRRRQVDQPARVDREAAHHLERGRRVLLADRHRARQPGLDDRACRARPRRRAARRGVLRRPARRRPSRNGFAGS